MMTYAKFALPLFVAALGACTTTADLNSQIPTLPEGAPKKAFAFKSESLLRGVRGDYNTIPAGRSAAILDVTYSLECLSGANPSANQYFAKAKKKLQDAYRVAPIYFNNPRERGAWNRSAKKLVIQDGGCQVTGVRDEIKTKESRDVLEFILKNRIGPA